MEDIRPYRMAEEDDDWYIPDDEREFNAAPPEDEVPFHVPRD